MQIFKGLPEPFYVVVRSEEVGSHTLVGARTHAEMFTIALGLLRNRKDVVGFVQTLSADLSIGQPFLENGHHLVAMRGDDVVDHTPIGQGDQGNMMQLVFSWTAQPNTVIRVMTAKELKSKL